MKNSLTFVILYTNKVWLHLSKGVQNDRDYVKVGCATNFPP